MELSERLPQVRIDESTMRQLQEKVECGTGNLSDHVRKAVEMYVSSEGAEIELDDETLVALQLAGMELALAQNRPLLSVDAIVKALISHWNASKVVAGKSIALGILPSGVLELGYS